MDAFYRSIHSNSGAYTVTGTITDAVTGQRVEARVQVLGPAGDQLAPVGAMWKVGTGEPFFYSDGEFTLQVPRGSVQVRVERGTEFMKTSLGIRIISDHHNFDFGLGHGKC